MMHAPTCICKCTDKAAGPERFVSSTRVFSFILGTTCLNVFEQQGCNSHGWFQILHWIICPKSVIATQLIESDLKSIFLSRHECFCFQKKVRIPLCDCWHLCERRCSSLGQMQHRLSWSPNRSMYDLNSLARNALNFTTPHRAIMEYHAIAGWLLLPHNEKGWMPPLSGSGQASLSLHSNPSHAKALPLSTPQAGLF